MELPPPGVEVWKGLTAGKKLITLSEDESQALNPEVLALIDAQNVAMPVAQGVDRRLLGLSTDRAM